MAHLHRRFTIDKFIGFDIHHKHTVAYVLPAGQPDRYRKLRSALTTSRVRGSR